MLKHSQFFVVLSLVNSHKLWICETWTGPCSLPWGRNIVCRAAGIAKFPFIFWSVGKLIPFDVRENMELSPPFYSPWLTDSNEALYFSRSLWTNYMLSWKYSINSQGTLSHYCLLIDQRFCEYVWPWDGHSFSLNIWYTVTICSLTGCSSKKPYSPPLDVASKKMDFKLSRMTWNIVQGDWSGWLLAFVDIKTKVLSQFRLLTYKTQLSIDAQEG